MLNGEHWLPPFAYIADPPPAGAPPSGYRPPTSANPAGAAGPQQDLEWDEWVVNINSDYHVPTSTVPAHMPTSTGGTYVL